MFTNDAGLDVETGLGEYEVSLGVLLIMKVMCIFYLSVTLLKLCGQ